MSFKELTVKPSEIFKDVMIFEPSVYHDLRGNIYTSYNHDLYQPHLLSEITFTHDKFAESKKDVLRGLHGDNKTWKLVSCVYGEIYEVVVDMRPESPTYKKWESYILSSENNRQVLIPPNFVNGYYVLSEKAVFHYKLAYEGDYIDADRQFTVKWDDDLLNIQWPGTNPILQPRDDI